MLSSSNVLGHLMGPPDSLEKVLKLIHGCMGPLSLWLFGGMSPHNTSPPPQAFLQRWCAGNGVKAFMIRDVMNSTCSMAVLNHGTAS